MSNFFEELAKNVLFAVEFLLIAVALFAVAYLAERIIRKKKNETGKYFTAKRMAIIAMLSAIAGVLMIFDFPVFFIPSFYKIDFSSLPALLGCFAYGPLAGVMIEFLKIIVKLVFKGTSTAFVGELASFLLGSVFVLTASLIYLIKKNKKTAIVACIAGTVAMTVFGCFFNAIYLLPAFSRMYGMPMEAIIGMGTKINSHATSVFTFVAIFVAPLNIIKCTVCSILTVLVYKPLRKIMN